MLIRLVAAAKIAMERLRRWSAFRMQAQGLNRNKSTGSSRRSTRRNRRGWEWGWRSAARSLRRMVAVCGLSRTKDPARRFYSACLPCRKRVAESTHCRINDVSSALFSAEIGLLNPFHRPIKPCGLGFCGNIQTASKRLASPVQYLSDNPIGEIV